MAEHTGESLPSSVEDSSISTGSVIDALVYAELAQVQAFQVVTGSAALNAHAGAEATRDLIQQIRSSCKDLSLPFDKKLCRVSHLVPQWVPTPIARLLGTEISAKDAMMSLAAARQPTLHRRCHSCLTLDQTVFPYRTGSSMQA